MATRYEVRGKLYVESTTRRTSVIMGSLPTLAEAAAYLAAQYTDMMVGGEELTIAMVEEDEEMEAGR